MALLAATAARRASPLIRPAAAAVSIRRMNSSSSFIHVLRAEAASLLAEAASLRAQAVSYRDRADSLRASSHDGEVIRVIESVMQSHDHSRQPLTGAEDEQDDLIASDEFVEFSALGEKLQQALHKYLELRGVTPVNTKILHQYTISKDRRRHLLWLTKLSDFVKKD